MKREFSGGFANWGLVVGRGDWRNFDEEFLFCLMGNYGMVWKYIFMGLLF